MGLYIHIPFCKQACSYCNFHFSTSLGQKAALLNALREEIVLRRDVLGDAPLQSIYLGGGTPSLLTGPEIQALFDVVYQNFKIDRDAEITLEANPDDLTADNISVLKNTPVNRLSVGVQSFYDDELQFMHRAHNAEEAVASIGRVANAGFRSWTMDLIYGTPFLTKKRWQESLAQVASIGAPHLSAYQLTVEPGTLLAHQIGHKKLPEPDDDATVAQFELLMDWAEASGYVHYEISNLSKPGHRAMHNSNYWQGTPYLGIGPSAHSYDGSCREWNVANNALYIKGITAGSARADSETLTRNEVYNEFIMTRLRTSEGIPETELSTFGEDYIAHFRAAISPSINARQVEHDHTHYRLTRAGKFFADRIASELFL